MVPELTVSMLACERIGAIHNVIFSSFSDKSIRDRVDDSKSKVVITEDGGFRRGTVVKLKQVTYEAIKDFDFVEHVIVFEHAKIPISYTQTDKKWQAVIHNA